MSDEIRYKMQHLGDIFVDTLSIVVDSAKKHAKSVVLTYDIHDLKKKKLQCLGLIGRRIVQVKKAGLVELSRDDKLVELIVRAENIDKYIGSFEEERKMTMSGCEGKTV
jgi:hypothetical protein